MGMGDYSRDTPLPPTTEQQRDLARAYLARQPDGAELARMLGLDEDGA